MLTQLARGGLSKHLHNLIDILGPENGKVEQPPPNNNIPRRCKMYVITSDGKGHKSPKDLIGKARS